LPSVSRRTTCDAAELADQTRHGHLTLRILKQREPAQLEPEVPDNPRGHRGRDGLAVRGQPAFAADADHLRAQHEILDQKVLVALET
jgi:hypothetical protein